MSTVLSRRLDPYLRPGAVDGLALVRVLNAGIGTDGDSEVESRRKAVTAMTGAMIRYASGRRTAALVRGRVMDAYRWAVLVGDLYEWVTGLCSSPQDPDADMLRVRLLQLHLKQAAARLPDAAELVEATSALVRVSLAGTHPLG